MYKEYFEGKKAVCFDLDGTLIDSHPYWDQAFFNVLSSVDEEAVFPDFGLTGLSVYEKWGRILKEGKVETKLSLEELGNRTKQEFLNLYEDEAEARNGFWPLAVEFKQQKGFKLALNTNTDRDVTDKILAKLEVKEAFDLIVCGDEVKKRKPHPEIYIAISNGLELKPKEILVFEDSVVGAKSAKKAGMDIIIIWNGEIEQDEYPKGIGLFVPDFESFPGNLDHTLFSQLEEVAEQLENKG